jgi:hypothetical protein
MSQKRVAAEIFLFSVGSNVGTNLSYPPNSSKSHASTLPKISKLF